MQFFKLDKFLNQEKRKIILFSILAFFICVCVISFFIPHIKIILLSFALVIFLCSCIIFDFTDNLSILLFFTFFQGLDLGLEGISFFYFLCSIFVFIFFIKYFFKLIKHKKHFSWVLFTLNTFLIFYGLINFNVNNWAQFISNAVLILLIFLCYEKRKEIRINQLLLFFITGACLSNASAMILAVIPESSSFVIGLEDRFVAFSSHTNSVQVLNTLCISVLIVLFFKKRINIFMFLGATTILTLGGLLTKSKAFLICLLILVILYVIFTYKVDKKKGNINLLIISVLGLITLLVFNESIINVLNRFIKYKYDNLFDKILTGRWGLWKTYLAEWVSSAVSLIFGCGVTAQNIAAHGPHSLFVEILFKYGIVGTLIIVTLLYFYLKDLLNEQKFKLNISILPILIFIILSFIESLLSPLRCVFVLLVLFKYKNDKEYLLEDKINTICVKDNFITDGENENTK